MKTIEIRCSTERRTKGRDRKTRCNRYLGTMDEHSITLRCPCCKGHVVIVRTDEGVAMGHIPPQDKPLISVSGEAPCPTKSPSSSIPAASNPRT